MNHYFISMIHIYVCTNYDKFQNKNRSILIEYYKLLGVGIRII